MHDAVAVTVLYGRHDLCKESRRLRLAQLALVQYIVVQLARRQMLHHQIDLGIRLQHLIELYDVGMMTAAETVELLLYLQQLMLRAG